MAARAMWKAELGIDDLRILVKLFAAVQDSKIHFRLLHADDQTPVKQQMVDASSLEPVPPDKVVRAVEVDRGVFVRLDDQELAALEPKASRDITVERVVSADKLDERWFDRPYYLGPDGEDDEAYFAVAQTLEQKEWIGIAHWVMRGKAYAGALYGSDGYLLLDTLRNSQQVLEIDKLRVPPSRAPNAREVKLAEQLIGTLEDEFDATAYHDQHREKLLALLEAKAKGKVVRFRKAPQRKASDSLLKDLQASLKKKRASGGR